MLVKTKITKRQEESPLYGIVLRSGQVHLFIV